MHSMRPIPPVNTYIDLRSAITEDYINFLQALS